MKSKILGLILLTLMTSIVSAQELELVDGLFTYQKVVEVPGMKASTIYSKSKLWISETFNSAEAVIDYDSPETATILGKGSAKIWVETEALGGIYTNMRFSMKIEAKDDRFRVTFNRLVYKSDPPHEYVTYAEYWFSEDRLYKKNGQVRPLPMSYKNGSIKKIEDLITALTDKLRTGSTSDDW